MEEVARSAGGGYILILKLRYYINILVKVYPLYPYGDSLQRETVYLILS